MTNIRQRIACKAVIEHNGKVLILREASTYQDGTNVGRYHLPGGRIEPGEKYLDGMTREVREETGLEVTVGGPIYVGEWFPVIKGEPNQIVAIFFACKSTSDQVVLSDEHDHYEWIDPNDYSKYDLMVPDDDVLKCFAEAHA